MTCIRSGHYVPTAMRTPLFPLHRHKQAIAMQRHAGGLNSNAMLLFLPLRVSEAAAYGEEAIYQINFDTPLDRLDFFDHPEHSCYY
jgi:hypothetical protein